MNGTKQVAYLVYIAVQGRGLVNKGKRRSPAPGVEC